MNIYCTHSHSYIQLYTCQVWCFIVAYRNWLRKAMFAFTVRVVVHIRLHQPLVIWYVHIWLYMYISWYYHVISWWIYIYIYLHMITYVSSYIIIYSNDYIITLYSTICPNLSHFTPARDLNSRWVHTPRSGRGRLHIKEPRSEVCTACAAHCEAMDAPGIGSDGKLVLPDLGLFFSRIPSVSSPA